MTSHGGSGFASTYRLSTPTNTFFVKTSSAPGAKVMFEGEHESLNAIHNAVPSLCPRSFAWGELEMGGWFVATEFLELGGVRRTRGSGSTKTSKNGEGSEASEGREDDMSGKSLAQKLAKLHSTPAPVPEGYDKPQFGFPVTTCCGDTPQVNEFQASWAEFFGEKRLLMILERCEEQQGKDMRLRDVVERVVREVVPRLLGDGHLGGTQGIAPVVVHGDLWSGNKSRASFMGRDGASPDQPGPVEEVIFDPSAVYAHNEYEIGIMNMFGGFNPTFWREYHVLLPKTPPEEEYEDRVRLYEAYHHLNHHAIFGGYKSGAMGLLGGLVRKYGDGGEGAGRKVKGGGGRGKV
jgi:protein-ribulosamine 3-kinase